MDVAIAFRDYVWVIKYTFDQNHSPYPILIRLSREIARDSYTGGIRELKHSNAENRTSHRFAISHNFIKVIPQGVKCAAHINAEGFFGAGHGGNIHAKLLALYSNRSSR